ncbi:uncharacterized protein [Euphorbia lathyris]|uniref:uncharacterized protein n=1 Tax=Euphorbia lathyris TaxID=212925 RepID=UPI003313B4EE
MVQKLEEIKGGGGSIRVGTTGTISALMTRELESIKTSSQAASVSHHDKHKPVAVPVSVSSTTRKSLDEASSSSSRNINTRSPQTPRKSKSCSKGSHRIPILRSENVTLDRTPSRDKTNKKGTNIVEVVDIKCGHPDKAWASPITSKLRKLGFSKLSESIL